MRNLLIILSIFVLVVGFIAYNVKNNITAEFKKIDISNVNGIEKVYADLRLDFNIINGSLFSFNIYSFKVFVYDVSGRLLGENNISEVIRVNKGVNEESILIKNVQVFSSLENIVLGNRAVNLEIEFKVLGIKIKTKQNVTF